MEKTLVKAAACLALSILGLPPAPQAQTWTPLIDRGYGYLTLVALDAQRLFAFGSPSPLLRSTDGGDTWIKSALPESAWSFQATHPDTAWAWNKRGLYRSVNGASSWVFRKEVDFRLYGCLFLNGSQGFLTTENGGLHATLDGGVTWIQRQPALRKGLSFMTFLDPAVGFAVENDSSGAFPWITTAIKTADSGKTWTPLGVPQDVLTPSTYIHGLRFTSALQGVVTIASSEGLSLELSTQDGGASWSRREFPKSDSVSIHGSLGASFVYGIVRGGSSSGKPTVSRDGGATWISTAASFPGGVERMTWRHPDTGWAIGRGFIFKTVDGGITWAQQIATLTGESLVRDILFQDPLIGWSAVNRRIYRTADGGDSWSLQATSNTTDWHSLYLADPTGSRTLLALGTRPVSAALADAEVLGVSRDQGASWKEIEPDRPLRLLGISFGSARTGYTLVNHTTTRDSLGLLKTADQGDSWQFLRLPYRASGYQIQFVDANNGFLAALGLDENSLLILRIEQGGAASSVAARFPSLGFAGMHWEDAQRGWVLSRDTVHRTLDGGATWSKVGLGSWKGSSQVVALDARNVAVYSTLNRKLLRTSDGFATWSEEILPYQVRDFQFFASGEGYVLGGQGEMLRYSVGPVPVILRTRPRRISAGSAGTRFESGAMLFHPTPAGPAGAQAVDAKGRRAGAPRGR